MYNFLSFEKIIHVLQNSKNVAQNFDFVSRNCKNFTQILISSFAKFRDIRGKFHEITKTKTFAATLIAVLLILSFSGSLQKPATSVYDSCHQSWLSCPGGSSSEHLKQSSLFHEMITAFYEMILFSQPWIYMEHFQLLF